MRLYNLLPRNSLFNWPNKEGVMRRIEMLGQWLGTEPQEKFVPVFIGSEEAEEDKWGIEPSETGRPKIVSNSDPEPGVIAFLSSYRGAGHAEGDVAVHEDDLDNVVVIAHGIGSDSASPTRYHEYLVMVRNTARFLILGTDTRNHSLVLLPQSETLAPYVGGLDFLDYIPLSDQAVITWRRHNHE